MNEEHSAKGTPSRSFLRRWLKRLVVAVTAFFVVTSLAVLSLRWLDPPTTAFMQWHNAADRSATYFEWRDRQWLGDTVALAVVAAEDQRFADHHGLDLGAISDALDDRRESGRMRGASTISQQLVKNLFLWPGRSLFRKGLEAYLAVLLDALVPKRRILELYLNVIELGPGVYGVPAASAIYFGTDPSSLTADQAALLAAVLPNPNRLSVARPSDYVRERQSWIADQAARLRREAWLSRIDW